MLCNCLVLTQLIGLRKSTQGLPACLSNLLLFHRRGVCPPQAYRPTEFTKVANRPYALEPRKVSCKEMRARPPKNS
jgi:hypothetical protein